MVESESARFSFMMGGATNEMDLAQYDLASNQTKICKGNQVEVLNQDVFQYVDQMLSNIVFQGKICPSIFREALWGI